MGSIMKFPHHQIKSLPKFYNYQHVRNLRHEKFSKCATNNHNMINEELRHFPERSHLIRQEYNIKKEDESYQKFLLDELFVECGLNETLFPLHGVEKEFIITVDIEILRKVGILTNNTNITEKLLSYIEPFPFPVTEKTSEPWKAEGLKQKEEFVTIKGIRDFIEREYLAWKLKVDSELIKNILFRIRSCLYLGRSLRNAKRNLDLINEVPQTQIQNVANKIFLINLRPFKIETLLNFRNNFFGYEWDDAANLFPELMRKSYPYIMLFVKILQSKGFSESQIKKALPFLKMNLTVLIKRLNYLLSNSYLSYFQSDNEFLRLLFFNDRTLSNLLSRNEKSFKELLSLIAENERNGPRKFSTQELQYQLSKKFQLDKMDFNFLKRHPKLQLISETQISNTINFLREMQFDEKEIIESISIVLYPVENIKKALEEVSKNKEDLRKVGFVNGSVAEETDFFQLGTKSKRKTLQLCLYYMEKDHNFSGDGVLLPEDTPK